MKKKWGEEALSKASSIIIITFINQIIPSKALIDLTDFILLFYTFILTPQSYLTSTKFNFQLKIAKDNGSQIIIQVLVTSFFTETVTERWRVENKDPEICLAVLLCLFTGKRNLHSCHQLRQGGRHVFVK